MEDKTLEKILDLYKDVIIHELNQRSYMYRMIKDYFPELEKVPNYASRMENWFIDNILPF